MISPVISSPTPSPQLPELKIPLESARVSTSESDLVLSTEQQLDIFQRVFGSAPVGLCFLDLDYMFITLNERFARMHGLPIDTFFGRTVHEMIPAVAAQLTTRHYPVTGPKGLVEIEVTVDRSSSPANPQIPEKLVYLWSSQPIRDPAGAINGYSVALMDITLRKRYESALRDKEEYYRHAVELNPHIFWSTGPSGLNLSISHRFLKLTGLTKQAAEQEWQRGCLHADDAGPASQAWTQSLQNGTPYDSTYRIREAAGAWRWFRVRAVPRLSTSGAILGWYGTMEDIHERKLMEEAREAKILKLEEINRKQEMPFREDALTGLFNRRHFDNALQNETVRARRSGQPLALIMIDIDYLARYNDDHGSTAGDGCILAIARKLGKVLRRQGDIAARYEGGKFVVLLPDTNEEGAMLVALRAHSSVHSLAIPHHGSSTGFVTISIGITLFMPAQIRNIVGIDVDADPAKLVRSSELALSSAKAGGRNCTVRAKAM